MTENNPKQSLFSRIENPYAMLAEAIKMQLSPKYRNEFLTNLYYEIYGEGYNDGMDHFPTHFVEDLWKNN